MKINNLAQILRIASHRIASHKKFALKRLEKPAFEPLNNIHPLADKSEDFCPQGDFVL